MENIEMAMGALHSPTDARDWTLASVGASTDYPVSCFLETDWMVPSHQKKISCCVGCTGEEVVRQIMYTTTGKKYNQGTQDALSWRFVYALAKCLEGTVQPDGSDYRAFPRTLSANDGTYPALVAKILRKYGVPLAKYCPNDATLTPDAFCYNRNIRTMPPAAFEDAKKRKSGADMKEDVSNDGIKKALTYAKANGGAVMILRRIGESYWTDKNGVRTWDKAKLLPIRAVNNYVSGHEELLTGYDTEPKTGRTRIYWLNHWGDTWCDKGRGWEYLDVWLPYINEIRVVVPTVPTVTDGFKYHFTKTMEYGDSGPDVVALQHILQIEGCFPIAQSFTGKYGNITKAGVKLLQERHANDILIPSGYSVGTGFVGPVTLAWIIKNYGN
jgi:hypothetical protein